MIMSHNLLAINQIQTNQIQYLLVFIPQLTHQIQTNQIQISSGLQLTADKSISNVPNQSYQTQNLLVFDLQLTNSKIKSRIIWSSTNYIPIPNESILESSGLQVTVNQTQNLLVFDLLSMNQFQKNQIQNLRLTHC